MNDASVRLPDNWIDGEINSILALSDHLVRPRQDVGGNRETDLLCGFQINHQLKLLRLLFSVAHQEDQRPHVLLGRPFPVAQQDRVDHEPGLALAEQQVADRLAIRSRRVRLMKIEMGSMALADEGDGVGDGDRAVDLRDVVVAFLPEADLERGGELAAVVEQVHVEEQERPAHLVVPRRSRPLLPARSPAEETLDGHQCTFLPRSSGPMLPALDVGEVSVWDAELHRRIERLSHTPASGAA